MKLQRKTISQGATLTEFQYDQVLDNLAMFACDPDSLAWHLKINGGVVQVADQGLGTIAANVGGPAQWAPTLGLQRNILHQWNVDPVIESDDLELLQLAYRKAINPFDPDSSIKREIYEQVCELSCSYHIVLSRDVSLAMIDALRESAYGDKPQKLDAIRTELVRMYDEMEALSARPAQYQPEQIFINGNQILSRLEFLKEDIVKLTSAVCDLPYVPVHSFNRPRRNAGLIDQAQDKIDSLVKLVDAGGDGQPNQFSIPWLAHGCKNDVPRCACHVGHYCGCAGDCYVWVAPGRARTFRDFVLIVLSLAPPDEQDMASQPIGIGAANSPSF
ncbi:MAG: hypothetical protein HYX69_08395 [Planctomycetia bacterium]|nr:hypothetical protein [Planctomycetia bacterium]